MTNSSGECRRNLLRMYSLRMYSLRMYSLRMYSFLALVVLSGCAITDTGAIDYRRAELSKPNGSPARLMLPP